MVLKFVSGIIHLILIIFFTQQASGSKDATAAFVEYMAITGLTANQSVTLDGIMSNATLYSEFLTSLNNATQAAAVDAKVKEFQATVPKLFGLAGDLYQEYAGALKKKPKKANKLAALYTKMVNFQATFAALYDLAKKMTPKSKWNAANSAAKEIVDNFNSENPDFVGFVETIVGSSYN